MIGQTLRDLRERMGLTQVEMAARLIVAPSGYKRCENYGVTPRKQTLPRVLELAREHAPDLVEHLQARALQVNTS